MDKTPWSLPKNLGAKKFGGEKVIPGNIVVHQRGTRYHPGNYVGMRKDHTVYALKEGWVRFERHKLSGHKGCTLNPKKDMFFTLSVQPNLSLS